MMNWAKQQLANVAGTREPIYGPSAIQSVEQQAKTTPYTELTRDDLRWAMMDSTSVETQSFYMTADSGHIGMVQIIYSNLAGIKTTSQISTKIFYPDRKTPNLWSSDPLEKYGVDKTKHNFSARGAKFELSEDGKSYHISSTVNKKSVVDLKFTQAAPGFVVGKDGKSTYGTDPQQPWGTMRHAFWPRCRVEGTIITAEGPIDFAGRGIFVHALQGMKPHHAAAKWNFVDFQGPTYSAVMMEYETPPSYGNTTVNVGGVVADGRIIFAGSSNSATHTQSRHDAETGWPEPLAAKLEWSDGKGNEALLEGAYGDKLDKIDVMAEVPGFVKQIVGGVSGARPYIYQYGPRLTLKVKDNGKEESEEGVLFTEATFISDD